MNDKEIKKFYNSKEWKRKRIQILKRDTFECQDCVTRLRKAAAEGRRLTGEDAKIRQACEVHHIKELRDYPKLSLTDDNLISLCVKCHNIRHGRYPKKFKKKKPICDEMW